MRCDIPTVEPDDDFVARLAELAAASTPSRGGVVVPVAFGGPASRAVAVAATVAAVTAGAAAAATHLVQSHDVPSPPGPSVGIHRPAPSTDDRQERTTAAQDHPSTQAGDRAQDTPRDQPTGDDPVAPVQHEPSHPTSSHAPGDDHQDDQGDQGDPGDEGDQGDHGQQGSNDGDGDSGDSGDSGDGGPGSGDTGGGDGGPDDSSSHGGRQDGGGNDAGSGDGSGDSSEGSPSHVLIGSSD
jgi:hypothetical protein